MKDKLIQLLELCIEKDLDYKLYPGVCLIEVTKFKEDNPPLFYNRSYYDGFSNLTTDILIPFNDLIEKVKNYKK